MAIRKIPLFCLAIIFILLAFNVAAAKRRPEIDRPNRFAKQNLDVEFEKPIDGLKRKKRDLLEEMIIKERIKRKIIPESLESVNKAYHNHKRGTESSASKLKKRIKRDIEQFYELENTPNTIHLQKRQYPNDGNKHNNKKEMETKEAQIHNRKKRRVILHPNHLLVDKHKRRDKRNVEVIEKKKVKQHEKSSNFKLDKHKKNVHINDHEYKELKHKKHDAIFKKEKRHVKRYLNWRERMRQKREQKREMKNSRIHVPEHNHVHREKRFEKHEKASKNLNRFKRYKLQNHTIKRQKKHL